MISADQQRLWLQRMIAQSEAHLQRTDPGWLRNVRHRAKHAVTQLPVLNRKLEAWRYTKIDALLNREFRPAAEALAPSVATDLERSVLPGLDVYRLVIVNGRYQSLLSTVHGLPEGVLLGSLRAILATRPELIGSCFAAATAHHDNVLTALNTALIHDGFVLHIGDNIKLDRPIEVLYLNYGAKTAAPHMQVRNLIVLGKSAQASVIERFIGAGQGEYFLNSLSDISLQQGAALQHYRVQDEHERAFHLSSMYLAQHTNSHYCGLNLAFGAAWNRTDFHTTFKEPDAQCQLYGLHTVGDGQLSDFHLNMQHQAPGCASHEHFKGILYGKGRAVFDGRILVDKQAQHTDAQLRNDNLLLSRDAEVDTKPQLEIYADDVKCSHGTTVGQIDPQQLFYMRSRGIDLHSARKMLCLGFAAEILACIADPVLRGGLTDQLNQRLSRVISTAT